MATFCFNLGCPQPSNPAGRLTCQTCGAPLLLNQRYRGQGLLGQGGFGRTYLAVDEQADSPHPCVVKQTEIALPLSSQDSAEAHRRFQLEAQQLATLGQHPQIPQLLDVIENAQGQFLVQDYIPGPNLAQLVQGQPGDEALVRRVLTELLPVLQFIHSHQVIHRDIKPANMIAPPAPQLLVLVDFGASKYVYDQALLEKTGTVIGSAGYVAPEQALGKAVFASDIFSLGLTCLHLLTDLHPFDLYSVSEDAWAWRPFLANPVSPELARVLERMVNRHLRERYSTAQEVLADLRWGGLLPSPQDGVKRTQAPAAPVQNPFSPPMEVWEPRFVLNLPGMVANALAISANGRTLAAACSDGSVRLWNCTNGAALHTLGRGLFGLGHRGAVNGVVFTPDGQTLISGSEDGQVIQWNLARPGQRQPVPVVSWSVSALLLLPDLDTLVVGTGDGQILLVSLSQHYPTKTLIHHQDQVTALATDAKGALLVSGSRDHTLRLWALPSGRLVQTITAPTTAITALACHPLDNRIVSGDQAGQVRLWSPTEVGEGEIVQQGASSVTTLAISPNGQWLAIGTEDGQLALVQLQWQGDVTYLRHAWSVRAVAFTPDSRMIVSSGADETIRFWCLETATHQG
ncbi:MAG: protein kinase [Leptolyngbyaceae cyanobacterium SM2_5_2]|nr:protein kinase [Leptolyngbyaceae cyanobacterium SM2_5_2]